MLSTKHVELKPSLEYRDVLERHGQVKNEFLVEKIVTPMFNSFDNCIKFDIISAISGSHVTPQNLGVC